jgi:hypothetical protein
MPWIVFYLIVLGVIRGLRSLRVRRPPGLCTGCRFVHMQYGATGRNAVFCTFGGGVRPVQIDVLYCTDYGDRSAVTSPARIGFAPGTDGAEAK